VIGLGSPFGDDRAGWCVVEALAESPWVAGCEEQVTLTACRSPAAELPELLSMADIAIMVDAVKGGGSVGTFYRLSRPTEWCFAGTSVSSHGVGLPAMLELAQILGGRSPVCYLYGIEVAAFAPDLSLSEAVQRAVVRVKEAIEGDIANYCDTG